MFAHHNLIKLTGWFGGLSAVSQTSFAVLQNWLHLPSRSGKSCSQRAWRETQTNRKVRRWPIAHDGKRITLVIEIFHDIAEPLVFLPKVNRDWWKIRVSVDSTLIPVQRDFQEELEHCWTTSSTCWKPASPEKKNIRPKRFPTRNLKSNLGLLPANEKTWNGLLWISFDQNDTHPAMTLASSANSYCQVMGFVCRRNELLFSINDPAVSYQKQC